MFENLSERLERSFKILKGEGQITEINVAETLKEVRRALLDADVTYKVAKDFCDRVKQKAMGARVLTAVNPRQMMIKIMHDELASFMGGAESGINVKGNPAVVLVAGLNGSGKTTFSAKLALNLKSKRGLGVLLAACDTFRPAAITQLQTLGAQTGVDVFTLEGESDPVKVAQAAVAKGRKEGYAVVILDTAGRLTVDEELMKEISALHKAVQPSESLFVVDAMTGQDAVASALAFNEAIDYDGVVLSKMDGDTRGGAALSIVAVTGKPVKFVSLGEKMEALDVFHPERMADRILGMGDVVSLVEKAQEQFDEKEARELKRKLAKNQFNLNDFYNQIQQVRKMGDIKDLASMIPGLGGAVKDVDIDNDKAFKSTEAIYHSMTPFEREHPESINGSRRQRIARGSGTSLQEVNRLLKQFEGSRKMMKMAVDGSLAARMKQFRSGGGGF
ncbi:MAG: signal recognition particle protein [Bacteroidales bacterium]|nr:signal recognition particle protein [Bacteroidales bacterium]